MFLFEVYSAVTAGIVGTLIAAEAMRTAILLMSELHKASRYLKSVPPLRGRITATAIAPSGATTSVRSAPANPSNPAADE